MKRIAWPVRTASISICVTRNSLPNLIGKSIDVGDTLVNRIRVAQPVAGMTRDCSRDQGATPISRSAWNPILTGWWSKCARSGRIPKAR